MESLDVFVSSFLIMIGHLAFCYHPFSRYKDTAAALELHSESVTPQKSLVHNSILSSPSTLSYFPLAFLVTPLIFPEFRLRTLGSAIIV